MLRDGQFLSGTSEDAQLWRCQRYRSFGSSEGFYGICGFDAFTFYCETSGTKQLRAPLEFNARFTSASVGLSYLRKPAEEHDINQGEWAFILDADKAWCEFASQHPSWITRILRTPTTQKQALMLVSPETNGLRVGYKPSVSNTGRRHSHGRRHNATSVSTSAAISLMSESPFTNSLQLSPLLKSWEIRIHQQSLQYCARAVSCSRSSLPIAAFKSSQYL